MNVTELNVLWKKILQAIEIALNEKRVYDAFFKDTYIYSLDGNRMIISCASTLSATLLTQKYRDMISNIVHKQTGTNFEIVFKSENEIQENKSLEIKEEKPQFFQNSFLEPRYNFDTYVVGPTNKEAQTAALIVASTPGEFYNPLFIYSQSGLGKTHLLNSIGNYIREKNPMKRILFCSSQDFIDEYIKYVTGDKKEDDLKKFILGYDVLLVDDIQLLQNKTKTEEFFFSIFENLTRQNKQIVLTCDRLPDELSGLDQRLVTRFLRGLTVQIQQPTVDLAMQILIKKIENSTLNINQFDEDVIMYMAENFKNSIRNLEGALNRIIFYCALNHIEHIDLDVTQDALSTLIDTKKSKSKISTQKILNTVSTYYNLSVNQITGKIKTGDIVTARQISIYLIRNLLDLPFKKIGEIFSNRDHSTIMHSYTKVEEMSKTNKDVQLVINKLKKQLSST